MIRICFHGAESTGKTTLADRLSRRLDVPMVPEFGREWAETVGTEFPMDVLLAIADGQDAAMTAAAALKPELIFLDTDPLMTAAWAAMLFGEVPPVMLRYQKAEHYLLFMPDVPWYDDGTRFFGDEKERIRFAALAEGILIGTGVPFTRISGTWAERERQVLEVITELTGRV